MNNNENNKKATEEPISLVRAITDPEEQKRLEKSADEALERATQILQSAEKDEEGKAVIPLVASIPEEPASKKKFLVLIVGQNDDDTIFHDWELVVGRQAAYDYIKTYMESEDYIDLVESKIVVDVETINEMKSVYDFMDYVIKNDLVEEPGIYPHLDDYLNGDIGDYEEE